MHYLIVEDDGEIRNILKTIFEILESDGVFTFFKNGHEAWDWLTSVETGKTKILPDIALLDIRLPGPQGHEIAERIRQIDAIKNMGIILMTAYELGGDEYENVMRRSKADRYITKPLPGVKGLNEIIEEIMTLRGANSNVSDNQ
jgi:CheY-like chemotaxis protein